MSYQLAIGEYESFEGDGYLVEFVQEQRIATAPFVGVVSNSSNEKMVNESQWWDFLEAVGLVDTFTELMPESSVIADIKPYHLESVRNANKSGLGEWDLNRLLWLEFWMDWALTNCNRPVFKR